MTIRSHLMEDQNIQRVQYALENLEYLEIAALIKLKTLLVEPDNYSHAMTVKLHSKEMTASLLNGLQWQLVSTLQTARSPSAVSAGELGSWATSSDL